MAGQTMGGAAMSEANVLFDAPGPRARARHRILTVIGALLALAIAVLVIRTLASKGQFEAAKWKPFLTAELWDAYLLPGLLGTLKAAALAIVISCILGPVLALARMSGMRWLRAVATVWVEIFRAIPVLLMMIFFFGLYAYNAVFSAELNPLAATVTGLVLYNSAVLCEVLRSGVDQLPRGQREAGLSIGLSAGQTLRTILLPQAITAMLPTLVSQLVVILKDTALGYNITYLELLNAGNTAASNYSNLVPMIFVVALIFILINYSLTKLAEYLERRLKRRGHTAGSPTTDVAAAEPA